jgi:hypothetical protein
LAPDSSSFELLLKYVAPGDTIQLAEATYYGLFIINKNNITIIGAGSKTIIINNSVVDKKVAGISVIADNCKISGLKIISDTNALIAIGAKGNHNVFQNLLLDGTQYGLLFQGNFNCGSNIVASNNSIRAFGVIGDSNKLTTLEIRNVGVCYAQIDGDHNIIKDLNCFDPLVIPKNVVCVHSGNGNKIDGMNITRTASVQPESTISGLWAVYLSNGNGHVIKGVKYEGFLDTENPACVINVKEQCGNCVISDCSINSIFIRGGQNHRIVDCNAKVCGNSGTNVHFVNCQFESVIP